MRCVKCAYGCVCGCERNSVAKTICLVPVEKCVKNSALGTHTSFFSYFLERNVNTMQQRGLSTKRPTIVFFLGPTKPLPSYGFDRQACTTVLVKSREMTSRSQTLQWWLEGWKHKVLIYIEHHSVCPLIGIGTPPPL